jgi:hypothetical protein
LLVLSVLVAGNIVLKTQVRIMGGDVGRQTGFGLRPIFKVTTGNSAVLLIEMIGIIADLVLTWSNGGGGSR